ncbi:MAG: nucleotide exchange factor GrpE [Planctomycetota bacterium]
MKPEQTPEVAAPNAPAEEQAVADASVAPPLVEPPEEAVQRLGGELEELNDRHLRLAAEFDNYRKRMIRERAEMRERAQAELVRDMLEAIDDLNRVTSMDHGEAGVKDVLNGVELVERKLHAELERLGVERVGAEGAVFDPNSHEAVGTLPANSPEHDGTIAAVLQPGYRFGSVLLRPARVNVFIALEGGA